MNSLFERCLENFYFKSDSVVALFLEKVKNKKYSYS